MDGRGRPQTFNNAGLEHGDEIGRANGQKNFGLYIHVPWFQGRSVGPSVSNPIRFGVENGCVYTHYMREEP